ncbi:MAG: 2-amino-4-hydroxy-6-hydroxymethyldihydropteridine diphosphokinase [Candidatus Hydrogenedentes bacterium]|nr:2-amino-4-hydroxy-6-hydroxymethyldihydropteridine diphosphokinase [Candidatus Hydrogenedentota bacterium]
MSEHAYIALGSNVEPEKNIVQACALLAEKVSLRSVSTFYKTKALERPEQSDYRNGMVHVTTPLSPLRLKLDVLREIENRLGRVRTEDRYASRTIDLDIVVFDDCVMNEDDLVLPDPELRERPFIAVPLLELAPDLVLADTGEALRSIRAAQAVSELEPDIELTEKVKARLNL